MYIRAAGRPQALRCPNVLRLSINFIHLHRRSAQHGAASAPAYQLLCLHPHHPAQKTQNFKSRGLPHLIAQMIDPRRGEMATDGDTTFHAG